MAPPTRKRKADSKAPGEQNHRKSRRVSSHNARHISGQTTETAFKDGEIDVGKFVRARQNEIEELGKAMRKSKNSLTTRAFQNVPRYLRRRTASHNPRKVPKRLRARVLKEMLQDNTPIKKPKSPTTRIRLQRARFKRLVGSRSSVSAVRGKNERRRPTRAQNKSSQEGSMEQRVKGNRLLKPPPPQAKFRRRQIHKTWLPTHLFHAKRAHMTTSNAPLWRMAMPLTPTGKSYRPVHRGSSSRGAVAWDMSYISTIGLEGNESAILDVLKRFTLRNEQSFHSCGRESIRWISGSRFWQGWLFKPAGDTEESIAPAQIAWISVSSASVGQSGGGKGYKRKAFIRIHPAAFLEFWEVLLPICKSQKFPVTVTDLRFEIGSIDVVGPASAEALVASLHPFQRSDINETNEHHVEDIWQNLAWIHDTCSLPSNLIISMEVSDPRLRSKGAREAKLRDPRNLLENLSDWPLDKQPSVSNLFNTSFRRRSCRQMPSQKAINRRKSSAVPGKDPEPLSTDPQIPVMVFASQQGFYGAAGWTVLLPWKCLRIIWYSLMYRRLLNGGAIIFGGLDERRQVAFEANTPWFPADFPATKAGMAWEEMQRAKRKSEWERRPKGKRVEWESIDLGTGKKGEIGEGWACDWQKLLDIHGYVEPKQGLKRIPRSIALRMLRGQHPLDHSKENALLAEVNLEMLAKGIPAECARIYRLPGDDEKSREKWLALHADSQSSKPDRRLSKNSAKDLTPHVRQQQLAASLIELDGNIYANRGRHPIVPDEKDLIGFVTTGSFNLSEGRGAGVGSILLSKVLEGARQGPNQSRYSQHERYICIIRDAGQNIGRLARWQLAS